MHASSLFLSLLASAPRRHAQIFCITAVLGFALAAWISNVRLVSGGRLHGAQRKRGEPMVRDVPGGEGLDRGTLQGGAGAHGDTDLPLDDAQMEVHGARMYRIHPDDSTRVDSGAAAGVLTRDGTGICPAPSPPSPLSRLQASAISFPPPADTKASPHPPACTQAPARNPLPPAAVAARLVARAGRSPAARRLPHNRASRGTLRAWMSTPCEAARQELPPASRSGTSCTVAFQRGD